MNPPRLALCAIPGLAAALAQPLETLRVPHSGWNTPFGHERFRDAARMPAAYLRKVHAAFRNERESRAAGLRTKPQWKEYRAAKPAGGDRQAHLARSDAPGEIVEESLRHFGGL